MRALNVGDFVFLLQGLFWTVVLSFLALAAGGVIAGLLVGLRLLRSRVIDVLSYGYVGLFQGTPLLGQLLFFYFGLSILGLDVSAFAAAVFTLALYSAAFLSEIWRGAIAAVPRQQWEAGESLGLSRLQTLLDIVLPQAMRTAIPPTVGFFVILIKDSSLVSVLGFVELTRAAQIINNSTFRSFTIFGTVAVLYFLLCFPISRLSRRLEARFHH